MKGQAFSEIVITAKYHSNVAQEVEEAIDNQNINFSPISAKTKHMGNQSCIRLLKSNLNLHVRL